VTETLLIVARAIHFAASIGLAGLLCFTVFIAQPKVLVGAFGRLAWASLLLVLATGFAWFLAETASMGGKTPSLTLLGTVLLQTRFGGIFGLRLGLATVVAIALLLPGNRGRWAALVGSTALLGALAWVGHGADDQGADGVFHLSADFIHLLAAGAWIGGLIPLGLLLSRAIADYERNGIEAAHRAVRRFSALGIAAVGALLATGVINTLYLVGSIAALIGTSYGQLLLVKIALFVALVGLATFNREVLTPRLISRRSQVGDVLRKLRRNSFLEAGLGLGVLCIVGLLGTMVPGAHQQPLWPLPFRFSAAVLADPSQGGTVWVALASVAVGIALAGASFMFRRLWGALVVLWLVIIAFLLPSLTLLTVNAYPTTYFRSPTGYTAAAIAAGASTYATYCAICHGATGHGDGPAAANLTDKPADLAASHIYSHPDGDLFWWIGHGIAGTPMPGFDGVLDETARWNLLDFIHANADGLRAHDGTPAQAPDFAIECPDIGVTSLRALRGRIVHMVFAGPGTAARLPALNALDPLVVNVVVAARAPGRPFCAATGDDLAIAYAFFLPERARGIADAEFVIDDRGWLRAAWQPLLDNGWWDVDSLEHEIAEIRAQPVTVSPRPAGHAH